MQPYKSENDYGLGRNRNILLLGLVAFSTLAIFEVGMISLSFFFGILLILLSLRNTDYFFKPHGLTWLLISFFAISIIGLLATDVPFNGINLLRLVQLFYWTLLALFVYNSYDLIDKKKLSQVVFWTSLLFIVFDVTFSPMPQNAVAFTIIIMGPLGHYHLKKYWIRAIYAVLLVTLMLLNGSRTGAILSLIQTGLFFLLFTPRLNIYIKPLFGIGVILLLTLNIEPSRVILGKALYPINKEVGELLINPQDVFRNDMSWLQRKAQINKGLQIFEQYPYFGIGIFNFPRYNIKIDISDIDTDRGNIRNIDHRSAHNAYVALLAETGIIGLSTILLMFILAIWPFIRHLNKFGGTFEACIFISFIGLLIYFYLVSGFFGTSAWVIYGLLLGASNRIRSGVFD